ncbi:MAG: GTP cyclohydrolase FolE2 [Proteobacteria bacterium]|nr:GTP cyclohydrolase FolE2 [Pseudomonadota bacterium]
MNAILPDVSVMETSEIMSPLAWVGMENIDLPVQIAEADCLEKVHACVDVQVNLPAAHVKGIHMSRLYQLLDTVGAGGAITPGNLLQLLRAMIDSHLDCGTDSARLQLRFDLLARRPALVTEGLAGWNSYPVQLDASLVGHTFGLRARVSVPYSSTCPCSAALARQIVEQRFLNDFAEGNPVDRRVVAEWLRGHATAATPHSQRSEASVSVDIPANAPTLGLLPLVDRIERAVGTPVQTAVKRADEQAFAALNGENLMFVEDAARRIEACLSVYARPRVKVRHLESLHPHDAVAWAAPPQAAIPA